MRRDALTDDQRDIRHLVFEGGDAIAELPIALLPCLGFGTAGLQRPSLTRGGIVIRIDQRMKYGGSYETAHAATSGETVSTTLLLMPLRQTCETEIVRIGGPSFFQLRPGLAMRVIIRIRTAAHVARILLQSLGRQHLLPQNFGQLMQVAKIAWPFART